jgi:transcription elongation factor Elf1
MGMLDDEMMDVPCETCGREVKVRMDKLRTSPTVTCACGQQIKVDATDLDRGMRKVDAAEKKLDDAFKGFPKTIGG